MGEIRFTVLGDPVGKERPRFARGHTYTPAKTGAYEGKVWLSLWMSQNLSRVVPLIQKAKKVRLDMVFYFRNGKHPDCDNCFKAIADGLQGPGRLGNDNRFMGSMDFYFDKNNPRTEVTVSWL